MKILAIGDICGNSGCESVLNKLSGIKKSHSIDLVIANGENSAEGNGILPISAEKLFTAGVDVITGGNHTLRRKEIFNMLEENDFLLRPANLPSSAPGKGVCIIDMGYTRIAVINILGVVYLESQTCPFETADRLIEALKKEGIKNIFLDFHAEATSEKRALGFYLDGRITGFFGTHTHIPTADEQILPKGTAYITDIGMTGVKQSVLGVETEIIINRLKNKTSDKFRNAVGKTELNGCIFDIDYKTGKAVSVKRISV